MNEVKEEADRRQLDLVRKLLEVYNVNPAVCAFRAYESKLKKLKRQLKKADEYTGYLKGRVDWTGQALATGRLPSQRELLIKKHRQFMEEARQVQETHLASLTEEVGRVESLLGQTVPCDQCRACLSFANLMEGTLWPRM